MAAAFRAETMKGERDWKQFWEAKTDVSDFEFDRGTGPRDTEIEQLSNEELLEFIAARPTDVVFDAGCGSGANILLLQPFVRQIHAMDYSESAVTRCRKRVALAGINNIEVFQGDVCAPPLADNFVDRILCMSVFHYLDDQQARTTLREFARVLRKDGELVLHVKNLASLYLSTLWTMKKFLHLLGRDSRLENFRTFGWYVRELQGAGFRVLTYNSSNVFMIERMPRRLVYAMQRMELAQRKQLPWRTSFLRRHGTDLKIRAQLCAC